MNLVACNLHVSFHLRIYLWFSKMTSSKTHIEEIGEIMYIFRNEAHNYAIFRRRCDSNFGQYCFR